MTKFKILVCCFTSILFMQGCSQILESVLLPDGAQKINTPSNQEQFDINIKSLTFKNAQEANSDPYPRQLMLAGAGIQANVFNEADYLTPNIPPPSKTKDYLIGIGDTLTFQQSNEFAELKADLPIRKEKTDYLLGVGDELTLMQLSENVGGPKTILLGMDDSNGENNNTNQPNESVLKTSSIVGTNGNILLLGLGSIEAKNQSLNAIQTEVRNILIRNGLAPNFQLEITGFNSKKAFVTFKGLTTKFGQNVIPITNLPITLKELILNYGLQTSSRNKLNITLVRNDQKIRMTAAQIFKDSSGLMVIEDRDQIEISQIESNISDPITTSVGSNGNILLPDIGNLKAANRSLFDVQEDIARIIKKRGMIPNFQLEISGFNSKKFFLVADGQESQVVTLTDKKLNLKEAVLSANFKDADEFTILKIVRNNSTYRMTFQDMLSGLGSKVWIQDGDTIELIGFKYKLGKVFALAGAGKAQIVRIDPSIRETLADVLFSSSGALNNLLAKRSEVYLLRGQKPSVAYHLDAQNVSRILVAATMELRPNDIVYVADRPIISFSRALSEISPLRVLLRDIQDNNIP